MAKKNYILDTNVFVYEPNCVFMFEDNDLYIPLVALKELNGLKSREGEAGYSARKARAILEELRNAGGSIAGGIRLGEGLGTLYVLQDLDFSDFLPGMTRDTNDDYVLAAASWKSKNSGGTDTVLVTDDIDMRFGADLIGVRSEPFKGRRAKGSADRAYKGREEAALPHEAVEALVRSGSCECPPGLSLTENEFLQATDAETGRCVLAGYAGGRIHTLKFLKDSFGKDIHPSDAVARNVGQRFMQEALLTPAEEVPLAVITGPAGTAKTFMALACGLEQVLEKRHPYGCGSYGRILVTRANVEMDNTYGFLPGTEEEKVGPMMRPFLDNLNALMGGQGKGCYKDGMKCPDPVSMLFEQGVIKAEAMQYMRGRSITDTFVIIDEVQNCTPNQILGIVSRIGTGSKIVLLGDPEQIDNRFLNKRNNGLVFASSRFKGSKLCQQVTMKQEECARSPLAAESAIRLAH